MCFTHALIILSKLLRTTSSESTEQEPGFSYKLKYDQTTSFDRLRPSSKL